MSTELEKDKEDFITWLRQEKKIGTKVSKDYYYRCHRIERNIVKNIEKYLSNEKDFIDLITKIHEYGTSVAITKKKSYVLVGTLRSAVKKYGEYKYPEMTDFYNKQVTFRYE
jgi:hypothetical protein